MEQKFKCRWGPDDVRRRDVPKPNWAVRAAGDAVVSDLADLDNVDGLASEDTRVMEAVQTEQGPVHLGVGYRPGLGWMPTVATLQEVPFMGTRRMAISDRYFR